ncbi:MAG TPA: hypothetical protein VGD46_19580 [Rhizobacter sp.]
MSNRKLRTRATDRWAFWTYDQYPYVLGAKVGDSGTRRVPSSPPRDLPWPGQWVFVPAYMGWVWAFAVLDGAEGAQLKADLEALQEQYRTDWETVKEYFRGRLVERLTQNVIKHPKDHVNYSRAELQQRNREAATAARPGSKA